MEPFVQCPLIVNASGCMCDTKKALNKLHMSAAGGICTKTATLKHRPGNPSPRYWEHPDELFTINSMGLPNLGIEYYLEFYKSLGIKPISSDKHRCVSLAVMSLEESVTMLEMVFNPVTEYYKYIDAIEWNLSCPNLVGKGILAYDFQGMATWLDTISPYIIKHGSIYKQLEHGLKLPPYFEPYQFDIVAGIIAKYPFITFINTINSVPNGLEIDIETETTIIHPKNGLGGLGGKIVQPVALANVNCFYRAFRQMDLVIQIIGTGGVQSGEDIFKFVLAGADMVSVGSQLMIEGPGVFERLQAEFRAIMIQKGYANLAQVKGKLKVACVTDDVI